MQTVLIYFAYALIFFEKLRESWAKLKALAREKRRYIRRLSSAAHQEARQNKNSGALFKSSYFYKNTTFHSAALKSSYGDALLESTGRARRSRLPPAEPSLTRSRLPLPGPGDVEEGGS